MVSLSFSSRFTRGNSVGRLKFWTVQVERSVQKNRRTEFFLVSVRFLEQGSHVLGHTLYSTLNNNIFLNFVFAFGQSLMGLVVF